MQLTALIIMICVILVVNILLLIAGHFLGKLSKQNQLDTVQTELDEVSSSAKEKARELEKIKKDRDMLASLKTKLEADLEGSLGKCKEMERECTHLRKFYEEHRNFSDKDRSSIDELTRRLNDSNRSLEAQRSLYEKKLNEMEYEITELRRFLQSKEDEINNLKQVMKQKTGKMISLDPAKQDEMKAEIDHLTLELRNRNEEIASLRGELDKKIKLDITRSGPKKK